MFYTTTQKEDRDKTEADKNRRGDFAFTKAFGDFISLFFICFTAVIRFYWDVLPEHLS